jgi:glutamate-1-semialdehyde 2,1-aminomutase
MRLARAATGKRRIVRFQSHFHGWHDQVAFGVNDHLDGSPSVGVLQELSDNTTLVAPNDVAQVERVLAKHEDVAAVMLEPVGSSRGADSARSARCAARDHPEPRRAAHIR